MFYYLKRIIKNISNNNKLVNHENNKPNTYSSNVIVHLKCKKTDLGFNEDEISTLSNNSGVTSYEDHNTEQFHVIEEKKIARVTHRRKNEV